MSEYQYYEFRAIDRPLTRAEQTTLRRYSTRAEITATSFTNEYNWGSFKGDEEAWMANYFDAFLYLANWGTRTFKLRLPKRLLDANSVKPYQSKGTLTAKMADSDIVITFNADEEYEENWDCGEGLIGGLIPIRSELAKGDFRSLYLAWLLAAQSGALDDEKTEPPVPRGLDDLSDAQLAFAEFFEIDGDLVGAAAKASPPIAKEVASGERVEQWLAAMSAKEKDEVLARFVSGAEPSLGDELRVRALGSEKDHRVESGRTVSELLKAAEAIREERERAEAKRAAKEQARREREVAIARTKYLDGLVGREDATWEKVETLAAMKVGPRYDAAVKLIIDLRDLAERADGGHFYPRLAAFREVHARKPALLERLERADL